MYLKKIELQGFKSFANKTTIDFEKGITGVVGPNGSGKSNISDAIRWVLGEQKAKTLRGSKMEDVIFSGTSKRKALGFGEVSLVLDNKDNKIPIDYSEVSVTRRVYRSGESEYYINKTASRLKDIKELFMDTGIGTDGYSIIGQGKIEEILSSKIEDRRNLIEEAVGIVKYKSRKKESEKKLYKTKENLVRINDIVEELSKNIDSLKEQSTRAEKFIKVKEDLRKLEVNLFIKEIKTLKANIKNINNQKRLIEDEYSNNENIRNEIEDKFEENKMLIKEIDENIDRKQNQKQDVQNDIEKKESNLKINKEKISFLNKELVRLNEDLKSSKELILRKNNELSKLDDKKINIDKEIKNLNLILEDAKQNFYTNESKVLNFEEKIDHKKTEINNILNNITEKKMKINSIKSFDQNTKTRKETILKEKELLDEKKENIKKSLKIIEDEINDNQKFLEKNLDMKDEFSLSKEKNKEILEKYSDNINRISGNIHSNQSRLKMLSNIKEKYDGYYKGVKTLLFEAKKDEKFGRGLKGVVAELLETEEKYEKSIEISLGGSLQNIVTRKKEDAKRFINYLKKNKSGRLTFLPLESIKPRTNYSDITNVLKIDGVYGIASSLIKFDKEYKDIFEYLLGRTIIVKDMDIGIFISKKFNVPFKLVTLEGDIISKSGSMTGGDYKNSKSTSLIGRDREIKELKNQIKVYKEKHEKIISKHKNLKELLLIEDEKLEKINEKINQLKINISNAKNKAYNLKEQNLELESRIEKYLIELENLKKVKNDYSMEINNIEYEILNLEDDNKSLKESLNLDYKEYEKAKEKNINFNKDITETKIKIASREQNKNEISNICRRLNSEINSSKTKKEDIGKNISSNKENIKFAQESIKDIDVQKHNLTKKMSKLISLIDELKNRKSLYLDNFYKEQEKLKEMNENISKLQKDINSIDIKLARYESSLENYINKLWEKYELTIEMALEYEIEINDMQKVKSQIKNYKTEIKDLGNINLDAIEEYKEVSDRYKFLTNQREDLRDAKINLEKVVVDIESKMKEIFLEKFKIIKDNFKEVFQKLFGGGKSDIFLVDSEDVLGSEIEIIAQPPGKKLQNISLLSGGEKSLTAISLLFAILKFKPTPFCVLDEIEAALDDANVIRFSEYLREFSTKTQFIVITHRKGTMEIVDTLYGVTMEENGISKLLSVKLSDILEDKAS